MRNFIFILLKFISKFRRKKNPGGMAEDDQIEQLKYMARHKSIYENNEDTF